MKKRLIASLSLNVFLFVAVTVMAFEIRSVGIKRKADADLVLDAAEKILKDAQTIGEEVAAQTKANQKMIWEFQKSITNQPVQKAREIVYVSTPESRNEPKKTYSSGSVESAFDYIRKSERSMTEAQFAEYAKPFVGKYIRWTGWVDSVEKDGSSYTVKVDMDPPSTLFSVYEVHLENIDEYQALKIQKNQKLTFAGNIYSMSKDISLNIHIKPATLY